MRYSWFNIPGIILLIVISGAPCCAETLSIAPIFSSGMVLQRETSIPVWGKGVPGKTVRVGLAGSHSSTVVTSDGVWSVRMPALASGGPYQLTVASTDQDIALDDIWLGDVWIASGQSNMAMALEKSAGGAEASRSASHLPLRIWKVENVISPQQRDEVHSSWLLGSGTPASHFSAVGFYFGRMLAEKTGVPIGMIDATWGGTPIQAWTRKEVLAADAEFRPILKRWEQTLLSYPEAKARWDRVAPEERRRDFERKVKEARSKGLPQVYPETPPDGPDSPRAPAVLWNGMISPLTRLPIKGVIWYQGESNTAYAEQYGHLFPAMIHDWRRQWGIGSFPFIFVQLPNFNAFRKQVEEPRESTWAELREAQAHTRAVVPNTEMAVTIDVGESDEIHPRDKLSVGSRLANLALRHVYGQEVVCSGPRYLRHRSTPDGIEVEFSQVAEGLQIKGNGTAVRAIAVAGKDRRFVWAKARIIGVSRIIVLKPEGWTEILSVRYNWGDTPGGNLCNSAGLPAEPFRTDAWPGLTTGLR